MQQQADQQFNDGHYFKAIQLYKEFINSSQPQPSSSEQVSTALLNLSSAYFSACQYEECMEACVRYMQHHKELDGLVDAKSQPLPKVESYILYCRSIIKQKKLLTHQQHQLIAEAETVYPSHKVLQQSIKTVKQLQISENEDEYLDKMFEKLLCHPEIRNYLTDESFLTKVEKIIRNPSLAGALVRTDKRLEGVTEILLMAEQEDEEGLKK